MPSWHSGSSRRPASLVLMAGCTKSIPRFGPRVVHKGPQDVFPDDPGDLDRLALRLNYEDTPSRSAVDAFLVDCALHTTRTREIFLEVLDRHRGGAARP